MKNLTNYMTDLISWYDTVNGPLNPIDRMSFKLGVNSSSYMAPLCINLVENLARYHKIHHKIA